MNYLAPNVHSSAIEKHCPKDTKGLGYPKQQESPIELRKAVFWKSKGYVGKRGQQGEFPILRELETRG